MERGQKEPSLVHGRREGGIVPQSPEPRGLKPSKKWGATAVILENPGPWGPW